MRHCMEFHSCLHSWYDRKPEWRELRRQLVDARAKPGYQQRRVRLWPTLDRDRNLFKLNLFDRASCTDWIRGLWNN